MSNTTTHEANQSQRSTAMFRVHCPAAPDGKTVKVVQALGRKEVLEAAREIRWDPCAQCLLLALPQGERRMAAADIAEWSEAAEPHAQKVVAPLVMDGCYACGNAARCQQHAATIEREALAAFNNLLHLTLCADTTIEQLFINLPARDRALVQRWACHSDPEHHHRPIRQSTLAKEFNLSERQVRRILEAAEAENPTIFARLLANRNHRIHITHGGVVKD